MAGHSKWKQIKHKKGANDLKRGKMLTKHGKILAVVGRDDPNPDTNASLRSAIANAKADGVPRDNIERCLKKILGEGSKATVYTENLYEGYGPGGIPILVQSLTDNTNRAYTDIRTAFNKNGGNLGSSGSVKFLFDHLGVIEFDSDKSEDELFELIMETGGIDFIQEEEVITVMTRFEQLGSVKLALEAAGLDIKKSAPIYEPKEPLVLASVEAQQKIERFIEAVEAVDDTDEIFAGYRISNDLT